MKGTTIALLLVGIAVFCLANDTGDFVVLSLASLALLKLLPRWLHRHVSKVGKYHDEISHGLTSVLMGGNFKRFWVQQKGIARVPISVEKAKPVVSASHLGTTVFGGVYLAESAQCDSLVLTLYGLALFYAISSLKAGDLHTASVGIAMAATLGLVTHFAPDSLLCRFCLNFVGMLLLLEGIRSLWLLQRASAIQSSMD